MLSRSFPCAFIEGTCVVFPCLFLFGEGESGRADLYLESRCYCASSVNWICRAGESRLNTDVAECRATPIDYKNF